MPTWLSALVGTICSGVAIGCVTWLMNRQGWLISRRGTVETLYAAEVKQLREENKIAHDLIYALRQEILKEMIGKIGTDGLTPRQVKLMTYTIEELHKEYLHTTTDDALRGSEVDRHR